MEIVSAIDVGGDVLYVRARDPRVVGPDGQPDELVARGWVSATTHYYPPDQYQADGHLIEGAVARTMTRDEIIAYCTQLASEQNASRIPTPPGRSLV